MNCICLYHNNHTFGIKLKIKNCNFPIKSYIIWYFILIVKVVARKPGPRGWKYRAWGLTARYSVCKRDVLQASSLSSACSSVGEMWISDVYAERERSDRRRLLVRVLWRRYYSVFKTGQVYQRVITLAETNDEAQFHRVSKLCLDIKDLRYDRYFVISDNGGKTVLLVESRLG